MNEDLFKKLYYDKELSRKDIANAFGFSEGQVKYWRRKLGLPVRCFRRLVRYKLKFPTSPSLVYILGVMLGDGFLQKRITSHGTQFMVRLRTTEEPFAKSFCHHLRALGMNAYIKNNPSEPRVYVTIAYCKAFYEWYSRLSLMDIEEIAKKYPKEFLRGFYESEGWVSVNTYLDKRKPQSRFHIYWALGMSNYKRDVLEVVQRVLHKLGYNSDLHQRKDRPKEHYLMMCKRHMIHNLLQILNPCIKKVKNEH